MPTEPPGDCNLCGSRDGALVCVDNSYPIWRCRRCSLFYVSPLPDLAAAEDVHFLRNSEMAGVPEFRHDKSRVYVDGIGKLNGLHPGRGRILDIGCGFGLFLDDARRHGWDTHGVDVSEVGVRYAVEELGLANVSRTDTSSAGFPDGWFDAVTLWNLLEHVPDPRETLREVRRILVPGSGTVLVRVPNMLVHRIIRAARPVLVPVARAVGRCVPPFLGGISPPQHLYGFTPATLRLLLEATGFRVLSIHPARPHGATSPLAKLASGAGRTAHLVTGGRLVMTPAMVALGAPAA